MNEKNREKSRQEAVRKYRLSARGRTDRIVLDGCQFCLEGLRAARATKMRVEV